MRGKTRVASVRMMTMWMVVWLAPAAAGPVSAQEPVTIRPVGSASVYLEGIVSLPDTNDEYLTRSPDGSHIVFTRREGRSNLLHETRHVDGGWTEPVPVSFSGPYADSRPAFSPDGRTLWFASNRPLVAGDSSRNDLNIWFAEWSEDGWGEPQPAGPGVNTATNDSHPSVAASGNLYFVRWGEEPNDIYVARRTAAGFATAEKLGPNVNTEASDSHPFIDPDERFLLYAPSDRPDGFGGGDIYVSYRTESGGWTRGENLGTAVNSDYYEYSARIGPDGRMVFSRAGFGEPERRPADLFVIDIDIVDAE